MLTVNGSLFYRIPRKYYICIGFIGVNLNCLMHDYVSIFNEIGYFYLLYSFLSGRHNKHHSDWHRRFRRLHLWCPGCLWGIHQKCTTDWTILWRHFIRISTDQWNQYHVIALPQWSFHYWCWVLVDVQHKCTKFTWMCKHSTSDFGRNIGNNWHWCESFAYVSGCS